MSAKQFRQNFDKCVAITLSTGERCRNNTEPGEKYCKLHLHKELLTARKFNRIFRSWKFWVPFSLTVFFGVHSIYNTNKAPSHEDIRDIVSSEFHNLRITTPYTDDEIKKSLGIDCEAATRKICESLELASVALDSGRYKDAQEIYLSLALIFEDNIHIQVNLGLTYYVLGKTKEATKHFARALELDSENGYILTNLGAALTLGGKNDSAIQVYSYGLSLDPSNPTLLYNLAEPLMRKGLVDSARTVLRKASFADSTDAGILVNLGNILLMLDSLEGAEESYLKSTTLEPNNFRTWIGLGNLYSQQEEYERAIDIYNTALRVAPRTAAIYINLFQAHSQIGNINDANRMWEMAVLLDSTLAQSWKNRRK